MFQAVSLSIIRSLALYTQQTCMTYTTVVCTVKNSWWWTEELSKTCRVLFKKWIEKLVHLDGFIIRNYHDAWSSECQTMSSVGVHFFSYGEITGKWNLCPTTHHSWPKSIELFLWLETYRRRVGHVALPICIPLMEHTHTHTKKTGIYNCFMQ